QSSDEDRSVLLRRVAKQLVVTAIVYFASKRLDREHDLLSFAEFVFTDPRSLLGDRLLEGQHDGISPVFSVHGDQVVRRLSRISLKPFVVTHHNSSEDAKGPKLSDPHGTQQ